MLKSYEKPTPLATKFSIIRPFLSGSNQSLEAARVSSRFHKVRSFGKAGGDKKGFNRNPRCETANRDRPSQRHWPGVRHRHNLDSRLQNGLLHESG
jgi:hypothetical protein